MTAPAHLVAREEELSALQAALERACSGERQIVFILGEPGIGKTALVETFLDELCVAGYLAARFGEHAFPPGLAARLFRTTGGVPLFMVAFVDDLVARQMVRNQEERWRLGASLDDQPQHPQAHRGQHSVTTRACLDARAQ